MSPDDRDLEAELLALQPRRPSTRLEAAIADALARRGRGMSRRVFAWLPVPLAAAAIFLLMLREPAQERPAHASTPSRTPAALARPVASGPAAAAATSVRVAARNLVYDVGDGGNVTLADGLEARRYYRLSVEVLTWRDASAGGQVQWTLPREDVCVVPLQAY